MKTDSKRVKQAKPSGVGDTEIAKNLHLLPQLAFVKPLQVSGKVVFTAFGWDNSPFPE